MPRHHIKRTVILRALEEFSTELVDDLPGFFFDLILCNWVQKVAGICETVCTKGALHKA